VTHATAQERDYEPVRVHIASSDIEAGWAGRKRAVTRLATVVLDSNEACKEIAPLDPSRRELWILPDPGAPATQAIAQPNAGVNAVYAVTNAQDLLAVSFTAVSSATAASRQGFLEVKDAAGNIVYFAIATSSQTAGQTDQYSFARNFGGAVNVNAALLTSMGLPEIQLQPGWTVTMGLNNIQAGDQIENVVVTARSPNTFLVGGSKGEVQGYADLSFAYPPGLLITAATEAGVFPVPVPATDQLWAASPLATGSTKIYVRVIMISEPD